jgi:hypothetical protein
MKIAAKQLHALKQHHSGKLRLTDVKAMFVEMKDFACCPTMNSRQKFGSRITNGR